MKFKREELERYAQPLSDTEKEQCKHAINMVKDALISSGYIVTKNLDTYESEIDTSYYYELRDSVYGKITLILQGSYANNTNIRRVSDVDVSVVYQPGLPISFENYKSSIYNSLIAKFGKDDVQRKNKSINVKGNSYRKSIDVVPAFPRNGLVENGIYLITDKEKETIYNYPLQHIKNGLEKNKQTNYKYKKIVRIIKYIKFFMEECGISSAKEIGSFKVESLIWNVPNDVFEKYTSLGYIVEEVIKYLNEHLWEINTYYEVNGIKRLCNIPEDYTKYVQFVKDLNVFFEYEV
ncbi:MAG: nucleotidyltransferase domain-containing protein [Clostridia bacterium]|nr:nucleotidyltransferase domain-containing protein [Clostridia bacterium]